MKIVLQRVAKAEVRVDNTVIGKVGKGLLLLVGFDKADTEDALDWYCNKILSLRVFPDNDGKMNLSVLDILGEILIVSQFTLLGNCKKGRRPSYDKAASGELAERLYDSFVNTMRESGITIATGQFQAMMEVDLVNDGPVTLIIE